ALVFGHAGESFVDHSARLGPIACSMSEITPPQKRFHADVVSEPDTEGIFHKSPQITLAQIVAGPALERRHTPLTHCPVAVALVVVVDLREAVRKPANLSFGPVNAQRRKPVEDSRKGKLKRRQGVVAGKAHEESHRIAAGNDSPGSLAVMNDGTFARESGCAAIGMRRDWHREIDRRGPETVVFGKRVAFTVRKFVETNAFESGARTILKCGDGIVDAGVWNHSHRNQPVRRERTVLLDQPAIVGAD